MSHHIHHQLKVLPGQAIVYRIMHQHARRMSIVGIVHLGLIVVAARVIPAVRVVSVTEYTKVFIKTMALLVLVMYTLITIFG